MTGRGADPGTRGALAHQRSALADFPPRPAALSWPATRLARGEAVERLCSAPFTAGRAKRYELAVGVGLLLDWLGERPGRTWQQRWCSGEGEVTGPDWLSARTSWLGRQGRPERWRSDYMAVALRVAISADVVRPSLSWLMSSGPSARGALRRVLGESRDPEGLGRLQAACDRDAAVFAPAATRVVDRAALILASKGGTVAEITVGDVVELLDAHAAANTKSPCGGVLFYRMLTEMGVLGETAPPTLRHLRTAARRSPAQMIDRYGLVCRPVAELLVDYLAERQPALDYNSLESLANSLGNLFWADLEAHNPGIDSLALSSEVAGAWKARLRTITKKVKDPTGKTTEAVVERLSYRECLTPVRALYLDLACWAVENPERWGPWVERSPIGDSEIDLRKGTRQRKSRMDTRTRALLPVLPLLVAAVDRRRRQAAVVAEAARRARPGETFTVAGATFTRRPRTDGAWVDDPAIGNQRNLSLEEEHAFWAWATIEVLRATGIRIEELLELTHHSLVQYRLPGTGELIPLLQITPSKTDAERLLVVSPELADVLSAIIRRSRDQRGAVPLVAAYDEYERMWAPPAPVLFQRRINGENRGFSYSSLLQILTATVASTGLLDAVDGRPLHYTPHDFRRMFITDAIMNGLPPHIAQIIAGHRDIKVTLGYKAVYPEEAIAAHLAFLARRRSLRPSHEYRVPTDEEWQEFLGHFERRKVSIGTCARAFATPCIHEHACVRCPMLWPDPAQRSRIVEIRDNLAARIAEAEREGWLGDVDGLTVSLAGATDKLAQIDNTSRLRSVVDLPFPTVLAARDPAPLAHTATRR